MKIYRYNERTLQYERLHVWIYVLTAVAIMTLMSISRSRDRTEYSETELVVLEDEWTAFSENYAEDPSYVSKLIRIMYENRK